jgi:NAD(P)-dependent dehydrogenase (short-subunit alcohol dehydrogenase family)
VTDAVLITGAGGGMGLAAVAAFAGSGLLVLSDVDDERVALALGEAETVGVPAVGQACDVTHAGAVASLFDTVRRHGGLRSLVHTVGLSPTMADGRRVLDVDLVGAARVLETATEFVAPGTAGIFISSMAGHVVLWPELDPLLDDPLAPGFLERVEAGVPALDGATGYVLAKRGVIRLCERWATAWGRRGGRLVSISPGLIDTEMGRLELANEPVMAQMAEATPVHRPGTGALPGLASDIAAVAAFLCSDAASFVSGCDILVDGGLTGANKHPGAPA